MGRCPWQELHEVGDFGRFPVKKRPVFLFLELAGRACVFGAVFSRDGAATRAAESGWRGYRILRSR